MAEFGYELKRIPTARSLKVRVRPDGRVIVTAPLRLPERYVEEFINSHLEWISSKRQAALSEQQRLTEQREKLFLRGKEYGFRLAVSNSVKPGVKFEDQIVTVTSPSEDHTEVRKLLATHPLGLVLQPQHHLAKLALNYGAGLGLGLRHLPRVGPPNSHEPFKKVLGSCCFIHPAPQRSSSLAQSPPCATAVLDIKKKLDHITVDDRVVFAFTTKAAGVADRFLRAIFFQIFKRINLGADKTFFEIGVDFAGRLRRFRSLGNCPSPRLVRPGGQICYQS